MDACRADQRLPRMALVGRRVNVIHVTDACLAMSELRIAVCNYFLGPLDPRGPFRDRPHSPTLSPLRGLTARQVSRCKIVRTLAIE
jgi:hypothetical protein